MMLEIETRGHSHGRAFFSIYYHMPTFQAFHATIRVDDKDLPEYDVQVDDKEKQVSCWIPSEVGKVSWPHCTVCVLTNRLFRTFQPVGLPQSSKRISMDM